VVIENGKEYQSNMHFVPNITGMTVAPNFGITSVQLTRKDLIASNKYCKRFLSSQGRDEDFDKFFASGFSSAEDLSLLILGSYSLEMRHNLQSLPQYNMKGT
jgi:hypothetical protein